MLRSARRARLEARTMTVLDNEPASLHAIAMQVIPVIDLSRGRVVHARRGQRELYQPLRSPLCVGSEPLAVVEGLLRAGDVIGPCD